VMVSLGGKKGGAIQKGYKKHYSLYNEQLSIRAMPGSAKSQKLLEEGYYLK